MAEVEVTIRFRYHIPDGPDRQAAYGTMDLDDCLALDSAIDLALLLESAPEVPKVEIKLVPNSTQEDST